MLCSLSSDVVMYELHLLCCQTSPDAVDGISLIFQVYIKHHQDILGFSPPFSLHLIPPLSSCKNTTSCCLLWSAPPSPSVKQAVSTADQLSICLTREKKTAISPVPAMPAPRPATTRASTATRCLIFESCVKKASAIAVLRLLMMPKWLAVTVPIKKKYC